MAFKLKEQPRKVDAAQIDAELGKLTRNTGLGNFSQGDKFIIGSAKGSKKALLDIRFQDWEQTNESGTVIRSGSYPVLVIPKGNFTYANGGAKNTEEVYVPLSSFCDRVAFNNDVAGQRPRAHGRYPQRYQYIDIKRALANEDGTSEFTFNVTEYQVRGNDGINTQTRSIAACA